MNPDYYRAAINAPPEPSIVRPESMAEDARRWRAYWLAWFNAPTTGERP